MAKIINFIKSVPTRVRARREYNRDHYEWRRILGSQPVKVRRKTPLKTYNNASTGIRKKK